MKLKKAKAVRAWAVWSYDTQFWLIDDTDLIMIGARKVDVIDAWKSLSNGECERLARVEIREIKR